MNSWFLAGIHPGLCAFSICLSCAGIAGLYLAWRQARRNWPLIAAGWLVIVASGWPWMSTFGTGRGLALASLLPGLIAVLVIIAITPWRYLNTTIPATGGKGSGRKKRPEAGLSADTRTPTRALVRFLGKFAVDGVLSFAASICIALAFFNHLNVSTIDRCAYALMLFLLIWPALMIWSCSKSSLIKPAVSFVALSLGGLVFTVIF